MSRNRRPDKKVVGKSRIVPHRQGEPPGRRHERRLKTNLNWKSAVQEWCEQNNIKLEIKNKGHHWIFRYEGNVAEWWPSSAKFVVNKNWDNGVHVHDYEQVIEQLSSYIGES